MADFGDETGEVMSRELRQFTRDFWHWLRAEHGKLSSQRKSSRAKGEGSPTEDAGEGPAANHAGPEGDPRRGHTAARRQSGRAESARTAGDNLDGRPAAGTAPTREFGEERTRAIGQFEVAGLAQVTAVQTALDAEGIGYDLSTTPDGVGVFLVDDVEKLEGSIARGGFGQSLERGAARVATEMEAHPGNWHERMRERTGTSVRKVSSRAARAMERTRSQRGEPVGQTRRADFSVSERNREIRDEMRKERDAMRRSAKALSRDKPAPAREPVKGAR